MRDVCGIAGVGDVKESTGFEPDGQAKTAGVPLGLSLCKLEFCLFRVSAGGEDDEGPKVNDLEKEDAMTDPNPDPLRCWYCWSGDAAKESV